MVTVPMKPLVLVFSWTIIITSQKQIKKSKQTMKHFLF